MDSEATNKCKIESCDKPAKCRGMCAGHAERYRLGWRGEKLNAPLRRRPKNGRSEGTIGKNGYLYISVCGEKKLAHRLEMEKHLGRPLESHEHIHHLDGNPLNNSLSNLVLASQSQHISLYHKKHGFFCSIKGCELPHDQCGLCAAHYKRLYRYGDPFPEIETGCSTRLFKKRMEDVKQKRQAGDWFRFLEEGATIYIPTKS